MEMTPKEVAKNLVDSNIRLIDFNDIQGWVIAVKYAKQSSLLAVELAKQFITGDLSEAFDKTMYLLEIKEEIENLK